MPRPFVLKFRIDLFAYTISSLSFGWVLMNLLHGWRYDILVQGAIILMLSVVWALYGHLALGWLKRTAIKRAALQAELVSLDSAAPDREQA